MTTDPNNVEMGMYLFRHLLGFPESYLANCLFFCREGDEWHGNIRKARDYADYSASWTARTLRKMKKAGLIETSKGGYSLNYMVSSLGDDFTITMPSSVFSACAEVFKADINKAVTYAEKLFEEGRDPDEVCNILATQPEEE